MNDLEAIQSSDKIEEKKKNEFLEYLAYLIKKYKNELIK